MKVGSAITAVIWSTHCEWSGLQATGHEETYHLEAIEPHCQVEELSPRKQVALIADPASPLQHANHVHPPRRPVQDEERHDGSDEGIIPGFVQAPERRGRNQQTPGRDDETVEHDGLGFDIQAEELLVRDVRVLGMLLFGLAQAMRGFLGKAAVGIMVFRWRR